MLLFCATIASAIPVSFTLDTTYYRISDGHIKLEWSSATDTVYELQQANTETFADPKLIYAGPDRASFISGLPNGTYYYRVRAVYGVWSDPIVVEVRHQSLKLAFALFGIGAVVFLCTVFVVVNGARNTASNNI